MIFLFLRMIHFSTIIQRFGSKGEKTGWTFIKITEEIAQKLNPNVKKSYRIKGKLDDLLISGIAIVPMGEGDFILPLKAELRKKLKKRNGDTLTVSLTIDTAPLKINDHLLLCLEDEPKAKKYFDSLTASHQRYFSNWVDSAKTETTQTKRIVIILKALLLNMDYGMMIRGSKELSNTL